MTVWFYKWSGFAVERVKLTYLLTVWLCVVLQVFSCWNGTFQGWLICRLCVWFTGDQVLEWNVTSRLACWLSFFKMIRFWSGLCQAASAVHCMSVCAYRWSSALVELPRLFTCWLIECVWFSWSRTAKLIYLLTERLCMVLQWNVSSWLTYWLCDCVWFHGWPGAGMERCQAKLPVDWVWFFRW